MPTLPFQPRTISQIVPTQLPAFVRENYPTFIAFVQAYYEWLETTGPQVFCNRVANTGYNTVTLTNGPAPTQRNPFLGVTAPSSEINAYAGMYIVCLNGPAKGQTQKIASYDPTTTIVTLVDMWDSTNIPPPSTNMEIRDTIHPEKLLEYRDIDYTLDEFVSFFTDEFMAAIPGNVLVDERLLLKHIKQFYQARGTEASYRLLFRILFNENVELYYPKVDLFRPSAAIWYTQNVIKTTTYSTTFDYVNRIIRGLLSGATAYVEAATQQYYPGGVVTTFTLSNITGQFQLDVNGIPEQVQISYNVDPPAQTDLGSITDLQNPYLQQRYELVYQLLQALLIIEPGENYLVGETISITGGDALAPAAAIITAINQTYFTGVCQAPPTAFYLEPYFGPNDHVNTTVPEDYTQDGVCIPGMYYFSDVHSNFSTEVLTPNEILLAANTNEPDNFFDGDAISLVSGTGMGQQNTIVSYNSSTQIATVLTPWTTLPDGTTHYVITHAKGGIAAVEITDFGAGFLFTPTVTINTANGTGGVLNTVLGIVGTTPGQWAPGKLGGIGSIATTPDSFASSNKIIQDDFYWQDFSYDIRSLESLQTYANAVKILLHPAGLKMFGTVVDINQPTTDFLKILKEYTLNFDVQFFNTQLEADNVTTITIDSLDSVVVGATNRTFDQFKFVVFPPDKTWTEVYPFPNANYWSQNGPGNTQISNLQDRTIASFVDFPDQRSIICPDSDIEIQADTDVSLVGPIGQSFAALSQFHITGFPLDQGSTQYGDTQIQNIANIQLFDLMINPRDIRSNICVDGEVSVLFPSFPIQGNQVIYDFLEGINPQLVYNVSPNTTGLYNGVLGSSIAPETIDGTWTPAGVQLLSSHSQIINVTGVPINLTQCTVIVVAVALDTSTDMSLVNCIQSSMDNGYSIDLRAGGGITFRVQNNGVDAVVSYPPGTIVTNDFFMAALRFDHGLLTGKVSNNPLVTVSFPGYPVLPAFNSPGWYFGETTNDYVSPAAPPSMFARALFGNAEFDQSEVSNSPISVGNFDGIIAYAAFYDRPLFDYEFDFAYFVLKAVLQARGIIIHDTTIQKQYGRSRIMVRGQQQTIAGTSYIVKRQYLTGVSRVAIITNRQQVGISRIYGTTLITQTGSSAIFKTTTQMRTGISRIQRHSAPNTLIGISRIQITTLRNQFGTSSMVFVTQQTQAGVSRIQVTTPGKTQMGISNIRNTTFWQIVGHSRIRVTTPQTLGAVSRIQITTPQIQDGISNIYTTTTKHQQGVSNIYNTTQQVQLGVSNLT